MATFTLSNIGITAAVQSSAMEFNANGLTVYNSGLRIIANDVTVLEVDTLGNLHITGVINATSGYFKGTIEATSGIFTGTVNAVDGFLENLNINGLLSLRGLFLDGRTEVIESENYYITQDTTIDFSKDYYIYDEETSSYILKDIEELANPKALSWYENVLGNYLLSPDEQINSSKTYYTITGYEEDPVTGEQIPIFSEVDITALENPQSSQWYEKEIRYQPNKNIGIYSSSYINDNTKGFYIDTNGNIFANSIQLGEQAIIQKYIRLNDCWIFNPDAFNSISDEIEEEARLDLGDFINVNYRIIENEGTPQEETRIKTAIKINKNGLIRLGSAETGLILNGQTESIQSVSFDTYRGWRIDNDTATFNNIVARGSFKSSVFEYGEVQAIGGIVIVRPSSIIKNLKVEENNVICTVENAEILKVGGHVRFEGHTKYYIITNIQNNDVTVAIDSDFKADNLIGTPLVDFGQDGSIGVSINSSDFNSLFPSHSITIFRTTVEEDNPYLVPQIILGEIPIGEEYGTLQGKYGLFAENVYLKGSMIAKGENYSSGINTESEAWEKDLNFSKRGRILLWAGADGDRVDQIERANFRVDTYGNLYAGSGYFNGTIITDATITAAEIKAATLTGWGKNENGVSGPAALTIKDTEVGILFTDENNEKMILRKDKLTLNMNFELSGDFKLGDNSNFIVPAIFVNDSKRDKLVTTILEPNKIGFSTKGIPEDMSNIEYKSYFTYEDNGIKIYDATAGKNLIAIFQQNLVAIDTNVNFSRDVSYSQIVKYVQALDSNGKIIGYDLYIEE